MKGKYSGGTGMSIDGKGMKSYFQKVRAAKQRIAQKRAKWVNPFTPLQAELDKRMQQAIDADDLADERKGK
jgi:hypothetical protein